MQTKWSVLNDNKMDSLSDIVVGLDIGTTKIVAMVGRKNEHGKLEVLGLGKSESLGVNSWSGCKY